MSGFADHKRTISSGRADSGFSAGFSGRSISLFGCTENCVINSFIDGRPYAGNVKINKCGSRKIFYKISGLESKPHTFSAEIVLGIIRIDGAQITEISITVKEES